MEKKQNGNKLSTHTLDEKDKNDEIREALGCIFGPPLVLFVLS